jgi:hypothetical protein
MKLPNFLVRDDLLRLKRSMGIPRDVLGNLRAIEVRRVGATRAEIEKLAQEGLEVDKEEVVPLSDGTLSYKDRRVLLYIRDTSQYGGNYSDPKFHIADCITLQRMRENQRYGRYVIATRDDGLFQLHYINSGRRTVKRLDVCQHCLDRLNYRGFQLGMLPKIRLAWVQNFSIADFFEAYPKTLHHSMPIHNEWTAPTNDYSRDFPQISRAYREKRNWACETCEILLSKPDMQRYLQVHHINGLKNENSDENLKAVCVHCHALEPSHGHITAMRQYREFEPIWQRWRNTGVVRNETEPEVAV